MSAPPDLSALGDEHRLIGLVGRVARLLGRGSRDQVILRLQR